MEKFIIQLKTKTNGVWGIHYHQNITNSDNKSAMNVYVQHTTKDKRKAKRFYDEDEAIRIGALFAYEYQIPTIIKVR